MHSIKKIYLYAVSLISLIIIVISAIMLMNLVLKSLVFTMADQPQNYPKMPCAPPPLTSQNPMPSGTAPSGTQTKPVNCEESTTQFDQAQIAFEKASRSAQKQRDTAQAIAMLLVASPVFYYHWKMARKEKD